MIFSQLCVRSTCNRPLRSKELRRRQRPRGKRKGGNGGAVGEMEADIQSIVEKLNKPPFNKNLRLVDFDEKSPLELLQVLNDVFTEFEPQMAVDVRDENEEIRVNRMLTFLAMLKFTFDESQRDQFTQGLMFGEKAVVYPILQWCLQRAPQLKKRAYLARYLMPVDVPAEYMQDDMLGDLAARLKELQSEFKEVHKTVDQLRDTNLRPQELKNEITQLEEERNQLKEKIAKLERSTKGEPGFDEMIKVTSALRQEQEEEARLFEKMREQRISLQQAEGRLGEVSRRLQSLRQTTSAQSSADAILEQMQRDVKDLQTKVAEVLPRELNEKRAALAQLERARMEPQKTKEDVEELGVAVEQMERENAAYRERVDKTLAARAEDRLLLFRQHASVAAANRAAKEDEYDKMLGEKSAVAKELEEREARMSEMQGPNNRAMSREEFRQYGAKLREKTHQYKKLKQELADLRAESVVLHRTEQILKSRDRNLDDFLRQLEAKKGVLGYRETQEKLEKASEATAAVDSIKGQTLEDISTLVRDITQQLRDKKVKLQPQIRELKEARKRFQDIEANYFQKRSTYEKVAVGLEVERQQLEQECEAFQGECLREESRYHYLHALMGILEVHVDKVKQEEKWEAGDGRLLPEFKSYKELYQNKISQQESLSKQLRKQQKSIKENEAQYTEQKRYFTDLRNLLNIKLKVRNSVNGGVNNPDGGRGFTDLDMGGGANVMSLDRGGNSKWDN